MRQNQTLDDLHTPCVLIDLRRVEANLNRAQEYANRHNLPLRPHIKTHKLVRFAQRQIELGAIGITCQKIGEAEVMAEGGIKDILIPYNILGSEKCARLKKLHQRIKLAVTADNSIVVEGLAAHFCDPQHPLPVLIECDTGHGRCGVQSIAHAQELAKLISTKSGLCYAGLMVYPAAGDVAANKQWLAKAKASLTEAGLAPQIISNGGTPDLWHAHEVETATEHRPGTYIYLDRYQVSRGVGTLNDCALTVLTTLVSRPTENRAIIDAGSKALTSDTLGLSGFGSVLEYPEAHIVALSEEHGTIDVSHCPSKPKIGERIRIIPNHCCVVSNLFDTVNLFDTNGSITEVKVDARGRVA